jgi:hypothetical protein
MAKFSKKVMGKEVGSADVYAKPHTMSAGKVNLKEAVSGKVDPNSLAADKMRIDSQTPRVSAGDPNRDDMKTSGIKMRGTGAATKGTMCRGPMA